MHPFRSAGVVGTARKEGDTGNRGRPVAGEGSGLNVTSGGGAGGMRIPMKAATDSDGKRPPVPIQKRPLWPGVELGVVIVAVGCSFDVIFALYGQSRWR